MKFLILLSAAAITLISCSVTVNNYNKEINQKNNLTGSWQLISGKTITDGNTTITDYTKNQYAIKIFNASHFSFFNHDLSKGKNGDASFTSGSGTYTLKGNNYTENLEFCSYRDWEGRSFNFKIQLKNDTLIQEGTEKLEDLGINRVIIEKYIRIK